MAAGKFAERDREFLQDVAGLGEISLARVKQRQKIGRLGTVRALGRGGVDVLLRRIEAVLGDLDIGPAEQRRNALLLARENVVVTRERAVVIAALTQEFRLHGERAVVVRIERQRLVHLALGGGGLVLRHQQARRAQLRVDGAGIEPLGVAQRGLGVAHLVQSQIGQAARQAHRAFGRGRTVAGRHLP